MYIIGHNPCMSCIVHNPSKIKKIYVTNEKKDDYLRIIENENNDMIKKIKTLDKNSFLKISKDVNQSEHIVIDRENYRGSSLDELMCNKNNPSTLLILDQLTDQNNIGNIFRTAALTNVDGIIIPEHSSASVTSVTATISVGAVEVIRFHVAKNISRVIEVLKKNNYWIYSLEMKGKETLDNNFKFDKRSVIILGNEGKGIRKNIQENSDFIISLKQTKVSQIDSFNAANSMAIALYYKSLNNN